MIFWKILTALTDEILGDEIDFLKLKELLEALKQELYELTEFKNHHHPNHKDIQLKNGVAIGADWAALCLNDLIRSRQFMKGVLKAVEKLSKEKEGPIHIFYAGTGPFASLILPLLLRYTSEEIRFHLLEINEHTLFYLKRLIKTLEIEAYIKHIECADASTYQIRYAEEIDILISETMQQALLKEQQVPIMLNLVPQLREEVILIPSCIELSLAYRKNGLKPGNIPLARYEKFLDLLCFDKNFIRAQANKLLHKKEPGSFELCKEENFRRGIEEDTTSLVILTYIQVFEEEWIGLKESSLTIPKLLQDFDTIDQHLEKISLTYVIQEELGFSYEFS
ncbi:MAG: hypothetical protein AAF696_07785 [Bacteroidota bacterium]